MTAVADLVAQWLDLHHGRMARSLRISTHYERQKSYAV